MQKSPTSGLAGAARIALVAAAMVVGGCSKTSQPIPRSDGGPGGGGEADARRDAPAGDGALGSDQPGTLPEGKPCGGNNECASGFCADGVCCQTACNQDCWT